MKGKSIMEMSRQTEEDILTMLDKGLKKTLLDIAKLSAERSRRFPEDKKEALRMIEYLEKF